MSKSPAARIMDPTTHDGVSKSGEVSGPCTGDPVMIEGARAATQGQPLLCRGETKSGPPHPPQAGTVLTGSSTVFVNGKALARWIHSGDSCSCDAHIGIASDVGGRTVFVGDGSSGDGGADEDGSNGGGGPGIEEEEEVLIQEVYVRIEGTKMWKPADEKAPSGKMASPSDDVPGSATAWRCVQRMTGRAPVGAKRRQHQYQYTRTVEYSGPLWVGRAARNLVRVVVTRYTYLPAADRRPKGFDLPDTARAVDGLIKRGTPGIPAGWSDGEPLDHEANRPKA